MNAQETLKRAAVTSWAAWLGAGAALGLVFCATWWALLAKDFVPGELVETLVIPAGTADAIMRGVPFAFVPERLSFPPGSRLRVVNHDSVQHSVGDATIPAGATADIEAAESGQLVCTIHPAGHLEIVLVGRPPIAGMSALVVLMALATATVGWVLRTSG